MKDGVAQKSKLHTIQYVQHVKLEIAVWDYDRLGPSEVSGSVVVGWNENGSKSVSADTHWQQMVENPRRPVVYWHQLKVIAVYFVCESYVR